MVLDSHWSVGKKQQAWCLAGDFIELSSLSMKVLGLFRQNFSR